MDRFPNINRVDGDVPLPKVEEQLESNRQRSRENFKDAEMTPSNIELQIIDDVAFGLKIMFENVYKIDFKPILKDKIHIVKEGTLRDKYGRGMHQSPTGDIYLEQLSVHGSKIVFAKVLAHELIHYLSFLTIKVSEKDGEVGTQPHIGGLSILKYEEAGVRDYFDAVDEAATSYLSSEFLRMELNSVRKNPAAKRAYTDECLALDTVREWLHRLPDSAGIDKTEWDKSYIISIPLAEEMTGVIKSDIPEEEKIKFYKEKIGGLPKEVKIDFYLERTREIQQVYEEIISMFALEEADQAVVKKKTLELVQKLALLKLTGKGFWEIVRFIEKRLGPGSFKELAKKHGSFKERKA